MLSSNGLFRFVALLLLNAARHTAVAQLPPDWRSASEGVDGYPAGNMLEIALRRTQPDKLEMFKWRSEFIALLGVQPGPLVEREWKSLEAWPPLTGAGTWTGMTWWENQQRWHNMANMIFPSPITGNWLGTINMTLCFVKPDDSSFDLRTLAQSGEEVLELGILAYDATTEASFEATLSSYLEEVVTAKSYTFQLYSNGAINGPFTTAYNANGPPLNDGSEAWRVYMVVWDSFQGYKDANAAGTTLSTELQSLKNATIQENSSIDVVTRSKSLVCCKMDGQCGLDPEDCQVGVLGYGDTWATNCAQCPSPCETGYGVCSMLSTKTCLDVGGTLKDSCTTPMITSKNPTSSPSMESDNPSAAAAFSWETALVGWIVSVVIALA